MLSFLLLLVLVQAPSSGSTYQLDVTDPTCKTEKTDTIKIKVRPADGSAAVLIVVDVPIPADTDSETKAQLIASAIDADDQNTDGNGGKLVKTGNFTRTSSVVGINGHNVTSYRYVNRSGQKNMELREIKPTKTSGSVNLTRAKNTIISFGIEEEPLGISHDSDSRTSIFQLGFYVQDKIFFAQIEGTASRANLIENLAKTLHRQGLPGTIRSDPLEGSITWEGADLGFILFGTDDLGTGVSIGQSQVGS